MPYYLIMKKIFKLWNIVFLLLLLYIIFYNYIYNKFGGYISIINLIFWVITAICSYFLLGYVKCRKIVKKDSIQLVIIYTIIYLIFTYLLGIITGFANTPFSLKIHMILRNFVPFAMYVVLKEMVRYMLVYKYKKNKKFLILIVVVFIFIDIAVSSVTYSFSTFNEVFRYIGVIIIGSGFKSILLTYVSLNAGEVPGIIYSLIIEGYVYFVPFVPNVGEYLDTMFSIILPVMLCIRLSLIYEKNKEFNKKRAKVHSVIYLLPLILIVIILMVLISGVFKYKIFAIASNSMYPTFSRGDVVIMEKKVHDIEIKIGDVIVFNHEGRVYVHRITKIKKYNNMLYYTTKGDNNDVEDNFETIESDVFGIAKFYIPLIGYPTVWLSEVFV